MKNIEIAILFGSRAEGFSSPHSDMDVAVLGRKPLGLEDKISVAEWATQKYKIPQGRVDVVDIRRASPLLQFEIAKKGKLIYGKRADLLSFQIRAWRMYWDTSRFRRIRGTYLERVYA